MSRTYRLRHSPILLGAARKYVVGVGYQYRNRVNDELWRQVAHDILGLPCCVGQPRPYAHSPRYTEHFYCFLLRKATGKYRDALGYTLMDMLESRIIYPVLSVHCHPWIKGPAECSKKTWSRRDAGRKARRVARQVLKSSYWDMDNTILPTMDDYFSRRDFFD